MAPAFQDYEIEQISSLNPSKDFRLKINSVLCSGSGEKNLNPGQRLLLFFADDIRKTLAKINARLISLQSGVVEIEYEGRIILISRGLRPKEVVIHHPESKTVYIQQFSEKRNLFRRIVVDTCKFKKQDRCFSDELSKELHELILRFFEDFPLAVPDISKFNS